MAANRIDTEPALRIQPCTFPGCQEAGMYGENDFRVPKNDQPAKYWCFDHRPGTQVKEAAEPKFNQPGLGL